MWHVVCGDNAVPGVTQVAGTELSLQVLRDDLAVGPLADIDRPPCTQRVAFWQALWPAAVQPVPDFSGGLSDDLAWLNGLATHAEPVTLWHGDSAAEQLMLCRVAAALRHSHLPFFEVPCGTGDSRVAWRKAVAMHAPDELLKLYEPRLVSPARRQQLAAQWQQAVAETAVVRRWFNGEFHGEDYRAIDNALLNACGAQWQPLARAMAEVMGHCDGFFATDFFLFWRARELARAGRLQLSDDAEVHPYTELSIRKPS
ncbi:hypothetical protein ACVW0Y_001358 [Pseudomonas sp. TE3786]